MSKKFKLFNRKNINQREINDIAEYPEEFRDYYVLKNSKNFISFDMLLNSSLLFYEKEVVEEFLKFIDKKVIENNTNHHQLVFDKFVINWIRNPRYDSKKLVPSFLTNTEDPNSMSLNLSSSAVEFNDIFISINTNIENVVFNQNKVVEVFPNIIVFLDESTKTLKCLFGREIL
ncbi:DUF2714 domain-containing protein [Mycoplasmopsis anatis]|uniref:DUF2714 domain-containing protein n=1 Tax=Mycoplasmopsis anatis 1340 TaxID=1034808 RepID=F9QDV6_9BACT|nr:DUF2714 domain-containing protein [Mycoplasmopsis anatis]AWX69873.1 DUF2714 domain-containing protein [Mycoplasmopsis anatis]EGS29133.1 hypothetical protein GIG_02908 [Mycoplasmopsis anatis 1340]VEU73705.1 Protein of uncharacterised function (DUF2714) [Mycoplasmopsis anatis]